MEVTELVYRAVARSAVRCGGTVIVSQSSRLTFDDVWFNDRDCVDIIQIYDRIWQAFVLPDKIYIWINVRLCRAVFSLQLVALACFSFSLSLSHSMRCDSPEDPREYFFVSWLIAAYRCGCDWINWPIGIVDWAPPNAETVCNINIVWTRESASWYRICKLPEHSKQHIYFITVMPFGGFVKVRRPNSDTNCWLIFDVIKYLSTLIRDTRDLANLQILMNATKLIEKNKTKLNFL